MIKEQSLLVYCAVRIDRWPNGVIDLILMCLKRVNEPKAIFISCEKLDFCVAFLQQWGAILTALHWFSNQPWPLRWQKKPQQGQRIFIKHLIFYFYCLSRTAQTNLNVYSITYFSVVCAYFVHFPGFTGYAFLILHQFKCFCQENHLLINIMRAKFPHISPPVILAYIIDNKALCISCFTFGVGMDSLFQDRK